MVDKSGVVTERTGGNVMGRGAGDIERVLRRAQAFSASDDKSPGSRVQC